MELKVLIVSIACFSCLMPPVFSTGILEAKAVALGAAKGAALLGAKALVAKGAGALVAKGAGALVAKGAAAIAAKGPLLKGILAAKGIALLAAKGAALKGALLAKGALLGGAAVLGAKVVKAGAGIIAEKLPDVQPTITVEEPAVIPPAPVLPCFVIDYKPEFQFPLPQPPPPISTVTVEVREPLPGARVELITGKVPLVWRKLQAAARLKTQVLEGVFSSWKGTPAQKTPIIYDFIHTPRAYFTPYIEVTEEIKDPMAQQKQSHFVTNK